MLHSNSDTNLKRAHAAYRELPQKRQERRLRAAGHLTRYPATTCPHCRYDLRGVLTDDASFHPCPECGRLVSSPSAIMGWWRALVVQTVFVLCSGFVQGVFAATLVLIGIILDVPLWLGQAVLAVWLLVAVANAILIGVSEWRVQTHRPRRPNAGLRVLITGACLAWNLMGFVAAFFGLLNVSGYWP